MMHVNNEEAQAVSLTGEQLLASPLFNKGTAFTDEERSVFGLHGLLPYQVNSIEEQLQVAYTACSQRTSAFEKLIYLNALHDRNETLFFRLVHEHLHEMLPLIYTPAIGDASVQFSRIFRRSRGIFFSYPSRERIEEIVANIPHQQVDIIVVTDGERVTGLGDVGIGGLMATKGKLSLYTLLGGIHPARTLPVVLDVGTDNPELLGDPLYAGWRHERVRGAEYDQFVDRFVDAMRKRFPTAVLQWEDFGRQNALRLLKRHRTTICSFNDDIQGTAAVTLAGVLAACKTAKCNLREQRIVVYGAGAAGLGIAYNLLLKLQDLGLSQEEAKDHLFLVDTQGLVHDRLPSLNEESLLLAQPYGKIDSWGIASNKRIGLFDVVRNVRPSLLIGASGHGGAFSKDIVVEMALHAERPIIFPLSNPSRKSEAQPSDLLLWTEGRAIVATGSPFHSVHYRGRLYPVSQCNNIYVFPGIGLGCLLSGAQQVTDKMLLRAAEVLSEFSNAGAQSGDALFPALQDIPSVTKEIALVVAATAMEEGFAPKVSLDELGQKLTESIWTPHYTRYVKDQRPSS